MNFFLLLLSLLACCGSVSIGQSDTGFNLTLLESRFEGLSDSTRFEKVSMYCDSLVEKGKFPEAMTATAYLMQIAQKFSDRTYTGRAYMSAAYVDKNQNKSNVAIKQYQKAFEEFTAAANVKKQVRVLQMIAGIYLDLNELKMSEHYCRRALAIIDKNNLQALKAGVYTDLATIEDIRKNFDKALEYSSDAIRMSKENKLSYLETLLNRCIILKNAGQYQKSADTYLECLKEAKAQKDDFIEGIIYVNLPNTLLALNKVGEAEMFVNKALDWAKSVRAGFNVMVSIYETVTMINEKKGDYKQALFSQKQWFAYRDSILNEEKSRQLIETETKFQTREKQQQIQQLDEENNNKRKQLFWLAGGVSLLLILLAVELFQYRKIKSVNQKLSQTNLTLGQANQQISVQSVQLKQLMQELHHRVKNNLAIISSLLYLQANRLDDKKAVQAVLDGQQRVEAMSLIHQQLYQTDNVTRVGMQEYIGDLVNGLMQSFHYQEKLDLTLEIEDISLDVELAVPLGLIINELVTNVFKHAFNAVQQPELTIRLWQTDFLFLEVKDNGPGVDPENWKKAGQTFGKRLVISLAKQTSGVLEVNSDHGARFLLTLPAVSESLPDFLAVASM
ncbi:histidine kinase dimerization/phosphoacceptor domain -containing protein [Dyadobacter sp. CY356]|uniref:tetratricopeptide repeat-containing sensor histidine kinase n=1 Tax=Dyadobacter sp. CY356 TaxID=2906442 RepID=UPI001F424BAB|nr:histidine kinase dimerization/phosphoacceptor domain -containing protein [Dyadobacter sp. CY356]MCF0054991.1 sensor histidine kinase [Dyadobacter sp. CY356]